MVSKPARARLLNLSVSSGRNESAVATELGWSGQSPVARFDLGGGAPYLHVSDQLGRQGSSRLDHPLLPSDGEADLVGERRNQA